MCVATRSLRRILPSSIRIIADVVVATTFVSEAASKIVSAVITSTFGSSARLPITFCHTTRSPRPTSTTAPGSLFAEISAFTSGSIVSRRAISKSGSCAPRVPWAVPGTVIRQNARHRQKAVDLMGGIILPASGFRLPASGFRLPAPGSRLPAPGSRLEAGSWKLEAISPQSRDSSHPPVRRVAEERLPGAADAIELGDRGAGGAAAGGRQIDERLPVDAGRVARLGHARTVDRNQV